jgi:DNA-binding MarR family transcriptional regulator
MQTTTSQAADRAVDELGDAVVALVRTWRGVGRRFTDGSPNAGPQGTLAVLEMARLLGEGEHRLSEIAERRGVDQSVVSRQIGELQQRGLVCRRPDPSDRRASLVRLTSEGHEVLRRSERLRQEWLRGALARTPTTDVEAAARLVTALAEELQARANELGMLAAPPVLTPEPRPIPERPA